MLTSCIALWDIFFLVCKSPSYQKTSSSHSLSFSLSIAARVAMETQQLEIFWSLCMMGECANACMPEQKKLIDESLSVISLLHAVRDMSLLSYNGLLFLELVSCLVCFCKMYLFFGPFTSLSLLVCVCAWLFVCPCCLSASLRGLLIINTQIFSVLISILINGFAPSIMRNPIWCDNTCGSWL